MSYGTYYQNPTGTFVGASSIRASASGTQRYLSLGYKHSKLVDNTDNNTFYTIAGTKYDAARVIWGRAWRLPHTVELAALMTGTVVAGTGESVRITLGGDSIVLPLTGFWKEGVLSEQNDYAEIWGADKQNRTHDNARWDYAWAGYYKASSGSDCGAYEHKGALGVRPVLASSVIE